MKYKLNDMVSLKINGKPGQAKIFGYEQDGTECIYHLEIAEYDFDIKILEGILILGVNIITNGNTVGIVSDNEKVKAK